MWTKLRDLFGSTVGLQAELDRIRLRVERLEAVPSLGERVDALMEGTAVQAETANGFDARIVVLEGEIDDLNDGRKDMILAISDGIERTDRAERRVKNTIRRARKELGERGFVDPGVEAEAYEFRVDDGEGSEPSGLRAVPAEMAEVREEASSIRGVSIDTLRSARGF